MHIAVQVQVSYRLRFYLSETPHLPQGSLTTPNKRDQPLWALKTRTGTFTRIHMRLRSHTLLL